jgi:serine-type D-Ala-D-Ala carboxypeptidase/endopeptidase (penicillin-binding protein 4)
MFRIFFIILSACLNICSFAQESSIEKFLSDPAMIHASFALYAADSETGVPVLEYNPEKSLIPASVIKLITSAVALELLGPQYTFKTTVGYAGSFDRHSGKLTGNILIKGGGDPALGSKYFTDQYQDFLSGWITEIKKAGIKKIKGRVITDDSHFDYMPVPPGWLWEDTGNYYGAGTFGLSVFDNTFEIHINTLSDSTRPSITGIVPSECRYEFLNRLVANGTSDEGNVFSAPYSTNKWLEGKIPANIDNFVLKGSIADPPLLIAKIVTERLKAEGITVSDEPATVRLEPQNLFQEIIPITETVSPPLTYIIEVLNHESVNMFAEHLMKELGKRIKDKGSTSAGTEVVMDFLNNAGLKTDGVFIEDGSGLSPLNAINTKEVTNLLIFMKRDGKYFEEYLSSLPDAGKEGTLLNYFRDPVFDSRLRAKSGSMTRVRSYAGYFTTISGKNIAFCVIINNFAGSSKNIISGIENIIKEIILNK